MGRAAFAIGGQVIGTAVGAYFGGAAGAQLGGAIGGAAGGAIGTLAFPPPDTFGPQLDDTTLAPGTYGSPIGIAYGLSDMACDLVWVEGNKIKERSSSQSAGGKGGPSLITFQYFASFALLISDRPITGLRRLYFGKELVYDGTSEDLQPAIDGGSPGVGGIPLSGAIDGLEFRLYLGSSDQDPDPLIQAEDPDASAMRGMAYIVVENLSLERYGNGIPGDRLPVIAEVVTTAGVKLTFALSGYGFNTDDAQFASFDPSRGRIVSGKANRGIAQVYDILTGTLDRTDDVSNIPHPWRSPEFGTLADQAQFIGDTGPTSVNNEVGPVFSPDGALYVMHERWSIGIAAGFGIVMDAETGQYLGVAGQEVAFTVDGGISFAHGSNDAVPSFSNYHIIRQVDWLGFDDNGRRLFLYMIAVENGFLYFGPISGTAPTDGRYKAEGFVNISDWTAQTPEFFFDIEKTGNNIYAAYRDTTGGSAKAAIINITGFKIKAVDPAGTDAYVLGNTINLSSISPTADPGELYGCVWNDDAQTFTIIGSDGFVILDDNLDVIFQDIPGWTIQQDAGGYAHMSNIDQTRFWVTALSSTSGPAKDTVRAYSTETGALLEELDLTDWGLTDNGKLTPFWVYRSDIFVTSAASTPRMMFGDRFGESKISLSSVLLDMARRTGMAASDLDLTAVTRQIYGAPQKAAAVSAKGAWNDLMRMTDHEVAMIDGTITVKPRATSSSGVLTDVDLSADDEPELRRRTNAAAPPRRIELNYKSVPANLEPANQTDEFPIDVVPAGRTIKLETSLRMDDDEAWATVQRLLADASNDGTEMEIAVPYTRGDIEPGDIWDITSGSSIYPMRIHEIASGRVMKMKGSAAYPFLTVANTPVNTSRPAPLLSQISATEFALIDAHAFRDEFNGDQFSIVVWPRRSALQWNGGVIMRSTNPDSFSDSFATLTSAAIAAQATSALGDVPEPDAGFDRANTLNVRMVSGTPVSVTEEQALLGSNPIWVECGNTGEWELMQFATATEQADGTYDLTVLLRGRRGTEHLTKLHVGADRVIWADDTTALRKGGSNIGTELFYLSASIGRTISLQDITTRRSFTNNARALEPYSVVDIAGSRDGSDNLTITWARRSRIAGPVQNTTPPLGEDTESYEIDILAVGSPTTAVLRTLTATSETVTYTAAQQTTDFGAAQDPVLVKIYQLSAIFGRGVVSEAEL